MGEENDPHGRPPKIVPPPRIHSIQTPEVSKSSNASSGSSWRPVALLGVLIVLAGITLFVVPRWVNRPSAAPEAPAPTEPGSLPPGPVPGSDPATLDLAERARQKTRAEELEVRARELRERLIARDVARWAPGEFEAARRLESLAETHVADARYGDAEDAYAAAVADLQAIDSSAVTVLQDLLVAGEEALASGDARAAREAFELAMTIAPESVAAAAGLDRSEALEPVAILLRDGGRLERAGDLQGAARAYRDATSLDPMSRPAQDALARVDVRIRNDNFAGIMSQGLTALSKGEYSESRRVFARAGKMRPGSPQVVEALTQVDEAEKLQAIALHRARAIVHEEREAWEAAGREYEAVLAIDPNLQFAQEGRSRATARVDLTERLTFHIGHPDRLSNDDVFAEAVDVLDEARSFSPVGPRLQAQLDELTGVLGAAGTRVRVVLLSDDRTDVTVYQVGVLGNFEEKELVLRPGRYTVVGSRRGYRDVRLTLVVEPEGSPGPLTVRCEEKI